MRSVLTLARASTLDVSRAGRLLLGTGVAVVVLALLAPMFDAGPAPLTSDESLYLSEGYNIAVGIGPKYTSQEWINHRAPVFPALLAVPIRLTGGDATSAYLVPKLVVVALALATFLLGRELFNTLTGAIAAVLVAGNAFLRWLGTTLFLDGTETLFLLLFLLTLTRAFRKESAPWFAGAGALLGLAFLTKETAVLWLPLPIAFALVTRQFHSRSIFLGLAAYAAVVGAIVAGWCMWVFATTGRIYFWGEPDIRLAVLSIFALLVAATIACGWYALNRRVPDRLPQLARLAGLTLVAGFAISMFAFLELTSWPFPKNHIHAVPDYLRTVAASNSPPWPLVAAGVAWLLCRVGRDQWARLLVLALVLYLPFALFVANRFFEYRDLLPMLYIAYLGAAALAATALQWMSRESNVGLTAAAAVVALGAIGFMQTQELIQERLPYDTDTVSERNWDNAMVESLATWVHENVPEDTGIMSSRVYFSQLYVLDEAQHPIYQLPTVRVAPPTAEMPFLRPITTLFRWEDHRLEPSRADERWLYVHRYPSKLYYVALSEHDLLRDIRERSIDFLVVTGEDAGFSSFSYLDYFRDHPAFELVYADQRSSVSGAFVYRIDRRLLTSQPYQAVVSPETLAALSTEWEGASRDAITEAIDPDGVNIRSGGVPGGLTFAEAPSEGPASGISSRENSQ